MYVSIKCIMCDMYDVMSAMALSRRKHVYFHENSSIWALFLVKKYWAGLSLGRFNSVDALMTGLCFVFNGGDFSAPIEPRAHQIRPRPN